MPLIPWCGIICACDPAILNHRSQCWFLLHTTFQFGIECWKILTTRRNNGKKTHKYLIGKGASQEALVVKEPVCQCKGHKRWGFSPCVRKIPWGGHGNPLQYSCLKNLMNRGAWWVSVHRVTQSQTQLCGTSHREIFLLLFFSRQVVSNSLGPHGLQHARPPCPSPSPRICLSSCPLDWWCHPTISSSVTLFSFCLCIKRQKEGSLCLHPVSSGPWQKMEVVESEEYWSTFVYMSLS